MPHSMQLKAARIPEAKSFENPKKTGILFKLSGRRLFRARAWKKYFCVLDGYKFYYYENQEGRGNDKNSGIINLEYYNSCSTNENNNDKDYGTNTFVLHQSEKLGFFDVKHIFSSDVTSERDDWVQRIRNVNSDIEKSRSRSHSSKDNVNTKDSKKRRSVSLDKVIPHGDKLDPVTKDRAKGPKGRRLPDRKSRMPSKNNCQEEIGAEESRRRTDSASSVSNDEKSNQIQNTDDDDEESRDAPKLEEVAVPVQENGNEDEQSDVFRESEVSVNLNDDVLETTLRQKSDEDKAINGQCGSWNTVSSIPEDKRFNSTSSNQSKNRASSDYASTYHAYNMDRDIKSLKSELHSIQSIISSTNKLNQTKNETIENDIKSLRNDVDKLKTNMENLNDKLDLVLELLKDDVEDTDESNVESKI